MHVIKDNRLVDYTETSGSPTRTRPARGAWLLTKWTFGTPPSCVSNTSYILGCLAVCVVDRESYGFGAKGTNTGRLFISRPLPCSSEQNAKLRQWHASLRRWTLIYPDMKRSPQIVEWLTREPNWRMRGCLHPSLLGGFPARPRRRHGAIDAAAPFRLFTRMDSYSMPCDVGSFQSYWDQTCFPLRTIISRPL
jgi:hypothetical protein